MQSFQKEVQSSPLTALVSWAEQELRQTLNITCSSISTGMCDWPGIHQSRTSGANEVLVGTPENTSLVQQWWWESEQGSPPRHAEISRHSQWWGGEACKHPSQTRVAWRHPATSRDSSDYLSSWFAFQIVDSTQNKTQNGHNFPHSDLYHVIAEHKSSSIQTYL